MPKDKVGFAALLKITVRHFFVAKLVAVERRCLNVYAWDSFWGMPDIYIKLKF